VRTVLQLDNINQASNWCIAFEKAGSSREFAGFLSSPSLCRRPKYLDSHGTYALKSGKMMQ
jgi:hypothetical protein